MCIRDSTNNIDLGLLASSVDDLNDGQVIATHTSGDGTVTDIEETITTLVDNGDGTFTYVSEDGTSTTYDETTTSVALNADNSSIDYIDEDGNTTNLVLCDIVDNCETVTSISFDPSVNQIIYIDENGDTNNIDLGLLASSMEDLNDGQVIATHTSGDGTVTDIEETVTTLVLSLIHISEPTRPY